MKKLLKKTLFGFSILSLSCRLHFKPILQSEENPFPKNLTLTSTEPICHLVKESNFSVLTFQTKLENLAVLHDKMMITSAKAVQMDIDFFQYKMKNNLTESNLEKASKLQASLYRNYQQKFYEAKMQADNYLQNYFYQKDLLLNQIKMIPSHQKDLFRNCLLDFKSTANHSKDRISFIKDLNIFEHFLN